MASGFVFVLLSKTVRSSSTLKLAFIYVIAFCAAIFGLLGYVYWSTVSYLYEISDRTISAEANLLTKAYETGGRDGLIAQIDRRASDPYFSDWTYLLADRSFDYVAGNMKSWPAALHASNGCARDRSAMINGRPVRKRGGMKMPEPRINPKFLA